MEAMHGQRQLALFKTMLETAKGNYYQRISYLQVSHTGATNMFRLWRTSDRTANWTVARVVHEHWNM